MEGRQETVHYLLKESFACGCAGLHHCAQALSGCNSEDYPLVAAQAQLPRDTWHLPRPGTGPVSLALQGGLVTTGPSGKPRVLYSCVPLGAQDSNLAGAEGVPVRGEEGGRPEPSAGGVVRK